MFISISRSCIYINTRFVILDSHNLLFWIFTYIFIVDLLEIIVAGHIGYLVVSYIDLQILPVGHSHVVHPHFCGWENKESITVLNFRLFLILCWSFNLRRLFTKKSIFISFCSWSWRSSQLLSCDLWTRCKSITQWIKKENKEYFFILIF